VLADTVELATRLIESLLEDPVEAEPGQRRASD
jgi:hypothetical protein